MAKKKKAGPGGDHTKLEFPKGATLRPDGIERAKAGSDAAAKDPYRLKREAVEDLVTASEENSPPVSRAEMRKYHVGPKVGLKDWVKAILLKIWFAGVICYFFIWGLSTFSLNQWDHLVILSVALGAVTHLLTNNIYRFMAREKGAYDRWMMFPGESILWLPLDLIYAVILVFATVMTYNGINRLFAGPGGEMALGVEPILFGIFVTLWDLVFLGAKRLMKKILEDAKKSVREQTGK